MTEKKLGMPSPKRVGPDPVEPVTLAGLRFEAVHWGKERGWGQNGGYVAAVDPATRKEAWTLKAYDVTYDGRMEDDVQDVFITTLEADQARQLLIVTDENGRSEEHTSE